MECLNVTVTGGVGTYGNILTGVMGTLMAASCLLVDPAQWPEDKADLLLSKGIQEFDFIVVGAGSAGSALANRLSERENWKVLLIEAGGNPPIESQIPLLFFSLMKGAEDWHYKTEPDPKSCQGMQNQRCWWPRGKILGGCSALNAMVYMRGNRQNYDDWEKDGNVGWGYDNVLEYFKKGERLEDERVLKNRDSDGYHGTDGYLNVGRYNGTDPFGEKILEALGELGHNILTDLNAESQLGFSEIQGTLKDGVRHSSAAAYLQPIKNRKNLYVVKNALVTKIIINKTTKRATGVELLIKGKTISVKSSKEIILSAGVINSPQLLMLSGIGPKKHLNEMGIDVVADLPVGKNLQDHAMVPVFFKMESKGAAGLDFNAATLDYLTKREGILNSIGTMSITGFINTKHDGSPLPDIQFHFKTVAANSLDPTDFAKNNGYDDEFVNIYRNLNVDAAFIHTFVVGVNPKSRGEIILKTKNPLDKPMIYANYFREEDDVETLLRGIREATKLKDTKAFKDAGAKLEDVGYTPCAMYKFESDDYWRCFIRYTASTLYHPAGTAKMGPETDPTAVVTPRLRVIGVGGLRVADASIMPQVISGNTNAPSIMIGEKAADMIKEDWLLKTEL